MWENLLHPSLSLLNLGIRATAVYFFVLILLRISGKRQLGQMSATEFVAILLISNAVQNAMNGGDNSLGGGLFLAAILIVLSWAINVLTFKHRNVRLLFEGSPTLIIHKGQVLAKNLDKEHITLSEFHSMLRKQGVHQIREVATAVLEADGTLSLTKVGESTP